MMQAPGGGRACVSDTRNKDGREREREREREIKLRYISVREIL